MSVERFAAGLALFLLCLAVSIEVPAIFATFSVAVQELIRDAFLVLAVIGLLVGFLK